MQMTAPLGADASFNQTKDWKTINWMAVRQQVRRLQVRIAKATGWQMPPRANTEEHRFERLEPYEMKVSRTVPRGGWAGNGLPPLDSITQQVFGIGLIWTLLASFPATRDTKR